MPYKSEAQRRWMYAAEKRGEVPKGTAEHWQQETGERRLPERVGTRNTSPVKPKRPTSRTVGTLSKARVVGKIGTGRKRKRKRV